MKKHYGDIIEYIKEHKPDFVLHGCNCLCTMGAGVAKTLAKEYPMIAARDRMFLNGHPHIQKLGNIETVDVNDTVVVNMYTQLSPGPNFETVAYNLATRKFFHMLSEENMLDAKILMPRIGCGLATPIGITPAQMWDTVSIITAVYADQIGYDIDNITVIGLPGEENKYKLYSTPQDEVN